MTLEQSAKVSVRCTKCWVSKEAFFFLQLLTQLRAILEQYWLETNIMSKWSEVKVIKVPHLQGLKVKDILNWARKRVEIDRYILDYDYQKEPNREWFVNLVNTLLEDDFKNFINDKWRAREQKVIKSKNLGVTVQNEFIEIFKNSKFI